MDKDLEKSFIGRRVVVILQWWHNVDIEVIEDKIRCILTKKPNRYNYTLYIKLRIFHSMVKDFGIKQDPVNIVLGNSELV